MNCEMAVRGNGVSSITYARNLSLRISDKPQRFTENSLQPESPNTLHSQRRSTEQNAKKTRSTRTVDARSHPTNRETDSQLEAGRAATRPGDHSPAGRQHPRPQALSGRS